MVKFIARFIRTLGLLFIVSFSFFSIMASTFINDVDNDTFIGKLLEYTSFLENRFYDSRMKASLDTNFKSKEIALVKIDDYSLQNIGTWPIPREVHAQMINKLKTFGAKVVLLDVMYPEKAPLCGPSSPDTKLADAFKNFQVDGENKVFLAYTLNNGEAMEELHSSMYNFILDSKQSGSKGMTPMTVSKHNFPIDELIDSGVGLAHIAAEEDLDGIFRQYQIIANIDTLYFGSLGLSGYEAYTGKPVQVLIKNDGSGEINIKGKKLEINSRGETKIRFIGGQEQFDEIPLYDVITARDDDEKMKARINGKMIFVGSTALGAHDLRPTALDSKMPGVYMHINAAHMLLHQYFYQPINDSLKYSVMMLLAGAILLLFIQYFSSAYLDLISTALVIAGTYYADRVYFMPNGFEMKLFYCYFCYIGCYSWSTFLNFSEASKEKKQIKGTFARYVAPTIVDEMLKEPDKLKVGGQKMDITCLFSDVRDFTSISEKLTATELAASLNRYMGAMTDIVFETQGTLDKYIGDAIVAFWGAPLPLKNHAQYAVEGAIKMMDILPAINEEFKAQGRPEFKVGIGLNSGECSVGNMGSERIFSYTALGDNMNLGSRLESLCKYYGVQINISEFTHERLDHTKIKTRPIDKVKVKGKTKPVKIYEVLHHHHPFYKDNEALDFYKKAYDLFAKKNFQEASGLLEQILMAYEDDKPTQRIYSLCKKYLTNPELISDEHDVTTMTEK